MIKKLFLVCATFLFAISGSAFMSIPSKWHHQIESTVLKGFKKGEHLVISNIYSGTIGVDAERKYSLEVKVRSWDKPFTESHEFDEYREVFTVTLNRAANPKEMRAEFDHVVYEREEIKLRFSGVTTLVRVH